MAAPLALPAEVYGAGLVFARVSALVMLLPGIGEQAVPPRIRLAFALVLALAMYPVVRTAVPAIPPDVGGLASQVITEVLIGLALGVLLRLFLLALAVAGETMSIQSTLSFAQTANPIQAQPGSALTVFLTLLGTVLIFTSGLHHMFIGGLARSYTLFPMGRALPVGDLTNLTIRGFSESFALGIQLAAPVIVFSLVFNVAVGFVARVMPQFQVFFVASPLSVLLGLSIFALSLGTLSLVWLDRYRAFVDQLT
jgi:flagellar biosynthetic protein FliR